MLVDKWGLPVLTEAVDANDAIVSYPVSIAGKSKNKEGVPYHITLRWGKWDRSADDLVAAVNVAIGGLSTRRPCVSQWFPDVFRSKDGKEFHVLRFEPTSEMVALRDALESVFGKDRFPDFKPHITVDVKTWDQVRSKFLLPADVGIEVKSLEVALGNKVLRVLGEGFGPLANPKVPKGLSGVEKISNHLECLDRIITSQRGTKNAIIEGVWERQTPQFLRPETVHSRGLMSGSKKRSIQKNFSESILTDLDTKLFWRLAESSEQKFSFKNLKVEDDVWTKKRKKQLSYLSEVSRILSPMVLIETKLTLSSLISKRLQTQADTIREALSQLRLAPSQTVRDFESGLKSESWSFVEPIGRIKSRDGFDIALVRCRVDSSPFRVILRAYVFHGYSDFALTSFHEVLDKRSGRSYEQICSEFMSSNESTGDTKYDTSVKGSFDMLTKQKSWIPELSEMVVYHGSPKAFDKFSLEYAGSEQGVNIAWGLYFSEIPKGAMFYKKLGGDQGVMYKVKAPNGPYLDWNKVIAQQEPKVRKILEKTQRYKDADERARTGRFLSGSQLKGSEFYHGMAHYDEMTPKEVSQYLYSLGIVGVKYKHDEYFNYILFNADDAKILGVEESLSESTVSADELIDAWGDAQGEKDYAKEFRQAKKEKRKPRFDGLVPHVIDRFKEYRIQMVDPKDIDTNDVSSWDEPMSREEEPWAQRYARLPADTAPPVVLLPGVDRTWKVIDGRHRIRAAVIRGSKVRAAVPVASSVNESKNLKSVKEIQGLRAELAKAAQAVYDDWGTDEFGNVWCRHQEGPGGICHLIADEMLSVLDKHGFESATLSHDSMVHVSVLVKTAEGVAEVDIDPYRYESGGGYSWKKISDVTFDPEDVVVHIINKDPEVFEQHLDEAKKAPTVKLPKDSELEQFYFMADRQANVEQWREEAKEEFDCMDTEEVMSDWIEPYYRDANWEIEEFTDRLEKMSDKDRGQALFDEFFIIYEKQREESEDSSMVYFENPRVLGKTTLYRFTPAKTEEVLKDGFKGYGPERLGLTHHETPGIGNLSFAFEKKDLKTKKDIKEMAVKYGPNLFQFTVPYAVKVYHNTDYEDQVVFDVTTVSGLQFIGKQGDKAYESFTEGLEEGARGDWEKEGYTVKYIPHPGDWSKVAFVKLYDPEGNEVGKMTLSGLSKEQQQFFKRKGQENLNYAHINWSEIKPEHRGKRLYRMMLKAAVDGVKSQGSDGVSTTAQSPESERVWNKIKNKKRLQPNPGAAQGDTILNEPPVFESKNPKVFYHWTKKENLPSLFSLQANVFKSIKSPVSEAKQPYNNSTDVKKLANHLEWLGRKIVSRSGTKSAITEDICGPKKTSESLVKRHTMTSSPTRMSSSGRLVESGMSGQLPSFVVVSVSSRIQEIKAEVHSRLWQVAPDTEKLFQNWIKDPSAQNIKQCGSWGKTSGLVRVRIDDSKFRLVFVAEIFGDWLYLNELKLVMDKSKDKYSDICESVSFLSESSTFSSMFDKYEGVKGDWEKEGCFFDGWVSDSKWGSVFHVVAKDKNGKQVGSVAFLEVGNDIEPQDIEVDRKHRRKGIATAMYDFAEKKFGRKVISSQSQTADAKELWKSSSRQFGEGVKDIDHLAQEDPPVPLHESLSNNSTDVKKLSSYLEWLDRKIASQYGTKDAIKEGLWESCTKSKKVSIRGLGSGYSRLSTPRNISENNLRSLDTKLFWKLVENTTLKSLFSLQANVLEATRQVDLDVLSFKFWVEDRNKEFTVRIAITSGGLSNIPSDAHLYPEKFIVVELPVENGFNESAYKVPLETFGASLVEKKVKKKVPNHILGYIRGADGAPETEDKEIQAYKKSIYPLLKKKFPSGYITVYRAFTYPQEIDWNGNVNPPGYALSYSDSKSFALSLAKERREDVPDEWVYVIQVKLPIDQVYFHHAFDPVGKEHPKEREVIAMAAGAETKIIKEYLPMEHTEEEATDESTKKLGKDKKPGLSFRMDDDEGNQFTLVASKDGKDVGNIFVTLETTDSDCYVFSPYDAEPFYDDICDHYEVVNIQHLQVEKEYQRQGVATELMKKSAKEIKARYSGIPVYINASPMGGPEGISLDALVRFYQKFGFKMLKKYPQNRNALLWKESIGEEGLEEMRTKQLKLGDREVEAVLMAGGPGFKIYGVSDGVVIVGGKQTVFAKEGDPEFKEIMQYVNLRYQSLDQQDSIKSGFDKILIKHGIKKNKQFSESVDQWGIPL